MAKQYIRTEKLNPFFGKHHTEKSKLKISKANTGKVRSDMFRKKRSKQMTGKNNTMYGVRFYGKLNHFFGKHHTEETIIKNRESHIGRHPTIKTRILMSISQRNKSPEVIRKSLIRACPSSLESKMLEIIKCNKLPYKFVGNGKFMIGRKCPDFVNCNGEKTALEVFYRRHKEDFRGGLQNWKRNRSRIFARYGWKIIYFDERMVEEDYILKRLNS
jgi:very-short-patch-repair endonuclease